MSSGFTGFENPTSPYREKPLSISELVHHQSASFLLKAKQNYRTVVRENDWLLIDSSLKPNRSDLVLIEQYGEQYIASLDMIARTMIVENGENDLTIIGVITAIIRHFNHEPEFPSGSLDTCDIHTLLVPNPHVAFISRANGNNLSGFGITDNAMLIVRRDVDYNHGDLAIVYTDRKFICRRLNMVQYRLETTTTSIEMPKPLAVEGVVTSSIILLRQEILTSWLKN